MSTTVFPFNSKRPRTVPAVISRDDGTEVIWPVADLPNHDQCGVWLDNVILGTPYGNTVYSLWTHHPNLRESTEKLASYITPKWPSSQGGSLLQLAVERAAVRAEEAINQGQSFEGRIVGVYLYGLVSVITDVARLVVRGQDRGGHVRRWDYFAVPLLQWAHQHGIEQLVVHQQVAPTPEVVLTGLRHHMIARLTNPVDAGYLAKYASQG